MEFLFIFCVGWVLSHALNEKANEYSAAQEAHRDKYLARLNRDHPSWDRSRRERYLRNAARRNAGGHFAYLLRHGWSSTFNDFGEGWKKAKDAHEEWRKDHPKGGEKPSRWATFKAGWKDRWDRRPKDEEPRNTNEPTPTPDPEPTKTPPPPEQPEQAPETEPWLTDEEAADAEIYPWPAQNPANTTTPGNNAGSTNGAPVPATINAGEATNLDDVRRNSASFVNTLNQVHAAADQLLADTLRFASKDRESRARLERGLEAINNAMAEFGGMPQSLKKHQEGEEYANSAHSVDDINALRSS
jgi:hypothetical protein